MHLVAGSITELLANLVPLRPENLPDVTVVESWIDPDFLDAVRDEAEHPGAEP